MLECEKPIQLKSGLVVGCGKCPLCRARLRNDWSIRLQIHAKYHDTMPLMIGLSYDNDNLIYGNDGAVVYRPDVSAFIKAYKRKYHLTNDRFTYAGCCEYGDTFCRPHAHLLFFGDSALYDLWWKDSRSAERVLEDIWKKGHVWIGLADWSGIHYVCKYILKSGDNEGKEVAPFIIASKGLGSSFFDSEDFACMQKKLLRLYTWKYEIYAACPDFGCDLDSVNKAIDFLLPYVPDFRVILDNGKSVFLPRFFRKKLLGTFQHFKDSPLWLFQSLQNLKNALEFQAEFGAEVEHGCDVYYDRIKFHLYKIDTRLKEVHYNKQFKTFRK